MTCFHWTERLAGATRQALGMRSFATLADTERLLEYERGCGVEVRMEQEMDCLAEIRRLRHGWQLKMSSSLDRTLRADVAIHEIGHRYTCSELTAFCSPVFYRWWQARDELNACLWAAHFRIPTESFLDLLRKRPSWEDIAAECQAPDGLLMLKLHVLDHALPYHLARSVQDEYRLVRPLLAAEVWMAVLEPEDLQQWRIAVVHRTTREEWVYRRSPQITDLSFAWQELSWDLRGYSMERFWRRWHSRLERI